MGSEHGEIDNVHTATAISSQAHSVFWSIGKTVCEQRGCSNDVVMLRSAAQRDAMHSDRGCICILSYCSPQHVTAINSTCNARGRLQRPKGEKEEVILAPHDHHLWLMADMVNRAGNHAEKAGSILRVGR